MAMKRLLLFVGFLEETFNFGGNWHSLKIAIYSMDSIHNETSVRRRVFTVCARVSGI